MKTIQYLKDPVGEWMKGGTAYTYHVMFPWAPLYTDTIKCTEQCWHHLTDIWQQAGYETISLTKQTEKL